MRYSKLLVGFCVVTVIMFTCAVLYLNLMGSQVSDTLIVMFYGTFGLELASCAGITVSKVRNSGAVPKVGTHAREEEE